MTKTNKTGRPPIAPIDLTPAEQVSVLRSYGLSDDDIACGLGISAALLRDRYRAELDDDGARARAAMLCRVYACGMAGNVGAAKTYLAATENKGVRQSPWDIRKARERAAAQKAGDDPDWAFLKGPSREQ